MSDYPKDVQKAYEMSKLIREKAYAPYSKFKVGAAVKFKNLDKIYTGHNIENVAFPSCVCAEVITLHSAIADKGRSNLDFIVVTTDLKDPVAPCGNCRQIISEHVAQDFMIYLANLKGIQKEITMKELLTHNNFHSFS